MPAKKKKKRDPLEGFEVVEAFPDGSDIINTANKLQMLLDSRFPAAPGGQRGQLPIECADDLFVAYRKNGTKQLDGPKASRDARKYLEKTIESLHIMLSLSQYVAPRGATVSITKFRRSTAVK